MSIFCQLKVLRQTKKLAHLRENLPSAKLVPSSCLSRVLKLSCAELDEFGLLFLDEDHDDDEDIICCCCCCLAVTGELPLLPDRVMEADDDVTELAGFFSFCACCCCSLAEAEPEAPVLALPCWSLNILANNWRALAMGLVDRVCKCCSL